MRFVSITISAGMVLLALSPGAAATPTEGGPRDLALLEAHDGLRLTWKAPVGWSPVAYRIYADNQFVAVTGETSVLVEEATQYVVQAVDQDDSYQQAMLVAFWDVGPTDCGYVTFNTDLDEPPFIFFRVHGDCLYWIWELINNGPGNDGFGPITMDNRLIGGL